MKDEKKIVEDRKLFSVRIKTWQIDSLYKFVLQRKKNNLTVDTVQDAFDVALSEFIQKHCK